MTPTPTLVLPYSKKAIPQVGFGLWKVAPADAALIVYEVSSARTGSNERDTHGLQAIKSGYRLFDGAYDYGNEKEAGQGIRRAMEEGLVTREEIFVTTKIWNTCHQKQVPPFRTGTVLTFRQGACPQSWQGAGRRMGPGIHRPSSDSLPNRFGVQS